MTLSQRKHLNLAYAFRSFLGHLEGTHKALHTIKNYRSDLRSFEEFLEKGLGRERVQLMDVTREDLEKYSEYLRVRGFRTNTRRRKIMTIRKLLAYLTRRKKLTLDVAKRLPAPHKVERIPLTFPTSELLAAIRALPAGNDLQKRNRVLLWTLAETGCQVSEVTRLRFDSWIRPESASTQGAVAFDGKSARQVAVSMELVEAVADLKASSGGVPWLFLGFNKFGPLKSPITSRGVELLVKVHAERLGLAKLTPRTFRHSVVLHWHAQGASREEIQRRLGLKTAYAFRVYEPMLRSSSRTTSTA